jgi:hypothetical protein
MSIPNEWFLTVYYVRASRCGVDRPVDACERLRSHQLGVTPDEIKSGFAVTSRLRYVADSAVVDAADDLTATAQINGGADCDE